MDHDGQYRDFAGNKISQATIDADRERMMRGMSGPPPPTIGDGPNAGGIPCISRFPLRTRRALERRRVASGNATIRLSIREVRALAHSLDRPRPTAPKTRGAPRQPRPRARRTSASSSTSSADPGDGEPEPPPPRGPAHDVALAWLHGGARLLDGERVSA